MKYVLYSLGVVLLASTLAFAVSTIMGGAVDSTPNPNPPAPTSGSLICSGCVFSLAIRTGLFAGIRASDNAVRTSTDGITWTSTATQPAVTPTGIAFAGSRIVVTHVNTVSYSDNNGATWTQTGAIANLLTIGADNKAGIQCASAVCLIAGGETPGGGVKAVWRSTNSGTSWTRIVRYPSPAPYFLNTAGMRPIFFDGTTAIVAGRANGANNSPDPIYFYTVSGDGGVSWSATLAAGCAATDTYQVTGATLFPTSSTYIIGYCNGSTTTERTWPGPSTLSITPAPEAAPFINAITLTQVVPITLYITGRTTGTTQARIWSSSDGTTFTSIFNTGVVQNFGQPVLFSKGVFYIGTDADKLYKVQ